MSLESIKDCLRKGSSINFSQSKAIDRLTKYIDDNIKSHETIKLNYTLEPREMHKKQVQSLKGKELISSGGICFAMSSLFDLYKQSEPEQYKELHKHIEELLMLLIHIMKSDNEKKLAEELAAQDSNLQVLIHLIKTIQERHPFLRLSNNIFQEQSLMEFQKILGFNDHKIHQSPMIFIHRNSKKNLKDIVDLTGSVLVDVNLSYIPHNYFSPMDHTIQLTKNDQSYSLMDPNTGTTQGNFDAVFKKIQKGNKGPVLGLIAQSLDGIDKEIKATMLNKLKDNLPKLKINNKAFFLLYAIEKNYVELVEALSSLQDINPNSELELPSGTTKPWESAILSKNKEIIKAILQSPNMYSNAVELQEGESLLHFVVKHSYINENISLEMIKFLINKGVNPMFISEDEEYPLILAIEMGNINVINALLKSPTIVLNDLGAEIPGNLLNFAVKHSCINENTSLEMIEFLINNGVNPMFISEDEESPLILAIEMDNINVINALLKSPTIDLNDLGAEIPGNLLNFAVKHICINENTSLEMIEFLINNGVNPMFINEGGESPLILAIEMGNINVINALLKSPTIDLNELGPEILGNLLNFAVKNNSIEMIQILTDKGVVPNFQAPLMLAIKQESIDTHSALLKAENIDPKIPDNYGEIKSAEKYKDLQPSEEPGNYGTQNPLLKFQEETDAPITEPTNGNRTPKIN